MSPKIETSVVIIYLKDFLCFCIAEYYFRRHLLTLYANEYESGHFVEYILNRPDVTGAWRQHTEHEFIYRMANGTLPLGAFKNYLVQDYLYLVCWPVFGAERLN